MPAGSNMAGETVYRQRLEAIGRAQVRDDVIDAFNELTGWTFGITWAPTFGWEGVTPCCPNCRQPAACKQGGADSSCEQCAAENLQTTLDAAGEGHTFTCPHGVANCWQAMWADGMPLAVVTAQRGGAVQGRRRTGKAQSRRGRGKTGDTTKGELAGNLNHIKVLAAMLATELGESIMAASSVGRMHTLQNNIAAHRHEAARLRRGVKAPAVDDGVPAGAGGAANHHEQLVQRMLRHVHKHFDQRLGLQELADDNGLSLAHLSTLFSKTVGMPFRSYVKEYRLRKACLLLRDPAVRVSEAAYAVGYTDPNRFRLDFKQYKGLSPTAWRDATH